MTEDSTQENGRAAGQLGMQQQASGFPQQALFGSKKLAASSSAATRAYSPLAPLLGLSLGSIESDRLCWRTAGNASRNREFVTGF